MKTYVVPITTTVTLTYEVEVTCDSAEEAQEKALDFVLDDKAIPTNEDADTEAGEPWEK